MKLSLLSIVDHYPELPRDVGGFYRELLEQAELGDALGYKAYFVAEHHFHQYGAVPNPALFLTAAAQRTRRILLGPAVAVLPFSNPLTAAEDYAMLDTLSGGRLVLGIGSGYLKHEFAGYNLDPAEKRERFDENAAILTRLLAGERLTYKGRFHDLREVALNVLPLQPRVPTFLAVLRKEIVYHVGRQGVGLFTVPYGSLSGFDEIAPMIAEFRRGRRESGAAPMPNGLSDHIVALHTYVAETPAAARAAAGEAFNRYVASRLYAKRHEYEDIQRNGLSLMGSVDEVVDRLVALAEAGVDHVMTLQNFGGIRAQDVARSMRMMMEEVMPRVEARLAERRRAA